MKIKEIKNTVVHLQTQAEWDEYMGMCEEVGWVWSSGGLASSESHYWNDNTSNTCVAIKNRLSYSPKGFYQTEDYTILTLQELKDKLEKDVIKDFDEALDRGIKVVPSDELFEEKPKMKYKVGDVLVDENGFEITIKEIETVYRTKDYSIYSDEELDYLGFTLKKPRQVTLQEVRDKFDDQELIVKD